MVLRKDVEARNLRWTVTDTAISRDSAFLLYSSISQYVHLVNLSAGFGPVHSISNITEVHEELDFLVCCYAVVLLVGLVYVYENGAFLSTSWCAATLYLSEPYLLNSSVHENLCVSGHLSGACSCIEGAWLQGSGEASTGIWSLAWSPAASEVAAGTSQPGVIVYDLAACQTALAALCHQDDVNAVTYADPCGNIIVSGSDDTRIFIHDRCVTSLKRQIKGRNPHIDTRIFIHSPSSLYVSVQT